MKTLLLHIGMGKCGSSSIQNFFSSIKSTTLCYLSFPGQPDWNPIVSGFSKSADNHHFVDYNNASLRREGFDADKCTEYLKHQWRGNDCDLHILSSELICYLKDAEASKFIEWIQNNLKPSKIVVCCYFREPASSRYLSILQQHAKSQSHIKLYVPRHPWSINVQTYNRWSRICALYDLEWHPCLFKRDTLIRQDVVADFAIRFVGVTPENLDASYATRPINSSIDPHILCAVRRLIISRDGYSRFPYFTLAKDTFKLSTAAQKCLEDSDRNLCDWRFKDCLDDYIRQVSSQEVALEYVNLSRDIYDNNQEPWDPEKIYRALPAGLNFDGQVVSGDLNQFLSGIDDDLISYISELLNDHITSSNDADLLKYM